MKAAGWDSMGEDVDALPFLLGCFEQRQGVELEEGLLYIFLAATIDE